MRQLLTVIIYQKKFFVTSCGFGLIEQAAHRAANQVDHGDEVGIVPSGSHVPVTDPPETGRSFLPVLRSSNRVPTSDYRADVPLKRRQWTVPAFS